MTTDNAKPGLGGWTDYVLLWLLILLWLAFFIVGTLISSAPYREDFAELEGGVSGVFRNGLLVVLTYTLTNVAVLSVLAGVLGELGAKAILGADSKDAANDAEDKSSPKSSAVLRSFLVYLAFVAGVLILGDNPVNQTQSGYVRLAGSMSLVAFFVSYRPTSFGRVLEGVARVIGEARPAKG
jgi:hypothetical protein